VRSLGHASPTLGAAALPPRHPKSRSQTARSCARPVFFRRRREEAPPTRSRRGPPRPSSRLGFFSFSRDISSTSIASILPSSSCSPSQSRSACCVVAYAGLTFMPILHHSSPYQTPFSSLAWSCCMSVPRTVKRVSGYSFLIRHRDGSTIWANVTSPPSDPQGYGEYKLEQSMDRHREASAKKQHWTIGARALGWTLDSLDLDEDHELEKFAGGRPGLFFSKPVEQPADMLAHIFESSTLHPNLGKDIQELVTGSSPWADSLHLLPKASPDCGETGSASRRCTLSPPLFKLLSPMPFVGQVRPSPYLHSSTVMSLGPLQMLSDRILGST
jgi:hypothetical protein